MNLHLDRDVFKQFINKSSGIFENSIDFSKTPLILSLIFGIIIIYKKIIKNNKNS